MNLKDRKHFNVDMICFECFKFTCDLCNDYVDDDRCAIRKCTHCELTFCGDHATTWEDEPDPNICSGCKDFHCHLCTELDHVGSAQSCEQCMYDVFCTDCVIKNRSNRNPYKDVTWALKVLFARGNKIFAVYARCTVQICEYAHIIPRPLQWNYQVNIIVSALFLGQKSM